MKTFGFLSVFAGLFLSAGLNADICDKIYYMQSGSQVTLTGATKESLVPGARTAIGKDLAGVEIIHDSTQYEVITRFDGKSSCSEWKKTSLDVTKRVKGSSAFTQATVDSQFVKLHPPPYLFDSTVKFDYWFGFTPSMDTAKDTPVRITASIGKLTNASTLHIWYAGVILTRTIKGAGGVTTGTRTHFYKELGNHPDSAALIADLLEPFKEFQTNDTQTVVFKVQLLKINYDSIAPPTALRGNASRSKPSGFQATQNGRLVFIRPSEAKAAPTEALGLYNMMGHKVATLHPTGYLYQWNGKTEGGADASTGVYFVQSGSKVLGKFFFSR